MRLVDDSDVESTELVLVADTLVKRRGIYGVVVGRNADDRECVYVTFGVLPDVVESVDVHCESIPDEHLDACSPSTLSSLHLAALRGSAARLRLIAAGHSERGSLGTLVVVHGRVGAILDGDARARETRIVLLNETTDAPGVHQIQDKMLHLAKPYDDGVFVRWLAYYYDTYKHFPDTTRLVTGTIVHRQNTTRNGVVAGVRPKGRDLEVRVIFADSCEYVPVDTLVRTTSDLDGEGEAALARWQRRPYATVRVNRGTTFIGRVGVVSRWSLWSEGGQVEVHFLPDDNDDDDDSRPVPCADAPHEAPTPSFVKRAFAFEALEPDEDGLTPAQKALLVAAIDGVPFRKRDVDTMLRSMARVYKRRRSSE